MKLHCSALSDGTEERSWRWIFNQKKVFSGIFQNRSFTELRIPSAGPEQDGEYACVLETRLETVPSAPVRVNILKPSVIVSGPGNLELVQGQSGQLGNKSTSSHNVII